ncbi:MAG: hypothetical protein ACRCYO_16950 [Bacteroidia bacterium]
MKLICPKCTAAIAKADVNIQDGFAYCKKCTEYFRVADYLQTDETVRRSEKPFLSKITLTENAGIYTFYIPPMHWKRAPIVFVLIVFMWNFTTWYTLITAFDRIPYYFLVIGFLIGLILLYVLLKSFFETTTLTYSSSSIDVRKSALNFTLKKQTRTTPIKHFTEVVAHEENYKPVYGIEILFSDDTSIEFGSYTFEGERKWLIGELYEIKKQFDLQKRKGTAAP